VESGHSTTAPSRFAKAPRALPPFPHTYGFAIYSVGPGLVMCTSQAVPPNVNSLTVTGASASLEQSHHFSDAPDMIRNARFHRGRHSLMAITL
jgi:hypothetical protein